MTAPTEAPAGRELVVSRDLLLAFGASGDERVSQEKAQQLMALDVLGADGRPVEFAAPIADAVRNPLATLQVVASRPSGLRAADVWLGATRAVLHARSAGEAPVISVGRSLLPQLLVRVTNLGPRPRSDAPPFVASVAQVDHACQSGAAPPWPSEPFDRPQLWRLSWETANGVTGDLAVLDLGAGGLWRPQSGDRDQLTWSPVDSATLWRRLGKLFASVLEDRVGP